MQAAIDNRRLATVMTDAAGETVSDGQWRPDFGWGKGALAPTGEPTQRGESLVTASPNHDEKWGEFRSMSPSPRLITDNIPSSGQNPKILGRDDTEVIRDLIAISVPFSGHLLA
jgi:hypothetical protein